MVQLTINEFDALKQKLRFRYQELIEEVRDELEHSGERHYIELAGRVRDSGEKAVGDLLADLGAAIVDRHVRELREIESALQRIVDGRYGECQECGTDIAFDRLQAFPAARRCVVCQEQMEKTYAHEPCPTL